ncbi:MAG: zinc dependent phospholipase C family protein [Spirochaetota bacterium]|nr:zinc dependent phospholipase C family protein [Spirochaetota bacterium]
MPGLITHSKVFIETINLLNNKERKNPYYKSIVTLFKTSSFRRAGLFGTVGPNIFDFLPGRKTRLSYRNEISHLLHNDVSEKFITSMINKLFSYGDYNTEWSATQRAYLYGYLSHVITDSIFHPFILYWSGFPNGDKKKEIYYYREQHLLFEYNIDLYFDYLHGSDRYNFDIMDMLPEKNKIDLAIKDYLLSSINSVIPQFNLKNNWIKEKKYDNHASGYGYLDMVPYFIQLSYRIQRSNTKYLIKLINNMKRNKLFFLDLFVRYPPPRRINRHILNLHRERWYNPTGSSGLHYESVEDLLKLSSERTAFIWEGLEAKLYYNDGCISDILDVAKLNTYTGEMGTGFDDLKIKRSIRLRF